MGGACGYASAMHRRKAGRCYLNDSSRTRSYAKVGESGYVGMLYVAIHLSTYRNLTMSNNVHTAISYVKQFAHSHSYMCLRQFVSALERSGLPCKLRATHKQLHATYATSRWRLHRVLHGCVIDTRLP